MVKEKQSLLLLPRKSYALTSGTHQVEVVYARLKLRWSKNTSRVYTALEIDLETEDSGQARFFSPVQRDWPRVFAALGDTDKWVRPVPPRRLRALVGAKATIVVVQNGIYANVHSINEEGF